MHIFILWCILFVMIIKIKIKELNRYICKQKCKKFSPLASSANYIFILVGNARAIHDLWMNERWPKTLWFTKPKVPVGTVFSKHECEEKLTGERECHAFDLWKQFTLHLSLRLFNICSYFGILPHLLDMFL